jgi:glycosyltransferase involved in cell wall biosynthesis
VRFPAYQGVEACDMRICFVLQSVSIGGGSYAILQHAEYLASRDHRVSLVTLEPIDPVTQAWYPSLQRLSCLSLEDARGLEFDIVVATFWRSVEPALLLRASRHVYFVQSVESQWYAREQGELVSAVRATYSLGLPVITVGTGIKEHLEDEYGSRVWLARNGLDGSVFRPDGPLAATPLANGLRVLVEGPLGAPFKNVPRAIRLAQMARPAELWLLTSTRAARYPGVDRVFSQVPLAKTAEVYRSCDVLLKLSLIEGFGLPPLEMFRCGGTAVVYMVSGLREYIRPGINALALDIQDEDGVLEALGRLQADASLLAKLRMEAAATGASWPDWTTASARFADCLGEIVETALPDSSSRTAQSVDASPRVVPTGSPRRTSWRDALRSIPGARRALAALRIQWWAHVSSRRAPRYYGE